MTQNLPKPREVWTHYKGDLYLILDVLNTHNGDQEKFPTTVSYMGLRNMQRYSRPWAVFKEKFDRTGTLDTQAIADALALHVAREIMVYVKEPHLGGDVQLQAKIQVTVARVISAMRGL